MHTDEFYTGKSFHWMCCRIRELEEKLDSMLTREEAMEMVAEALDLSSSRAVDTIRETLYDM